MNRSILRRIVFFCIPLMLTYGAYGQIKVYDNGNIGLKYTGGTSLISKVAFNHSGTTGYDFSLYSTSVVYGLLYSELRASGGSHQRAIHGNTPVVSGYNTYGLAGKSRSSSSVGGGRSYGVYGEAGNATSGHNYAICGVLNSDASNYGAAVYGTISTILPVDGNYAGYFSGNVKVTGQMWANTVTESDERLKEDITELEGSSEVPKLNELKPVSYNLRQRTVWTPSGTAPSSTDALSDTINTDGTRGSYDASVTVADTASMPADYYEEGSQLLTNRQYGFLAQDMLEVYPDLVYTADDGTLGIDYIGLIPILVIAEQEHQEEISDLHATVEEQNRLIEELSSLVRTLREELDNSSRNNRRR